MLLIVAHHYVVNSGLLSEEAVYSAPLSWRSVFLLLLGAWGKTGINCFVLITGYFMCTSNITARKFAKLLCEIMFYRIAIYLIFLITGYEHFSIIPFVKTIIPITSIKQNFGSCFIVFYLCIPFLNILIHHLTERQHVLLLCLTGFLYVIMGTAHSVDMNYVSWFIVIFFIGSYIRLYPKPIFSNAKIWGWATLIVLVIAMLSVIGCVWIGEKLNKQLAYVFVADSNTFLAVALGVSSFLWFKNMRIAYSKTINTIAASTFGVLCIHANSDTMRKWLWGDLLNNVGHYGDALMPLHAIGSVLSIFVICTLIDQARIRLIERPVFGFWDKNRGKSR